MIYAGELVAAYRKIHLFDVPMVGLVSLMHCVANLITTGTRTGGEQAGDPWFRACVLRQPNWKVGGDHMLWYKQLFSIGTQSHAHLDGAQT